MADHQHRDIKLIVYGGGLFDAHWALFIPTTANHQVGKLIHAVGDARNGFTLEFSRNYDLSHTTRKLEVLPLTTVDSKYIVDTPGDGTRQKDTNPVDIIEKKASDVAVPGPSLRSGGTGTAKVEIKNCQSWMNELVDVLVADKIFPPEARKALDDAPKTLR